MGSDMSMQCKRHSDDGPGPPHADADVPTALPTAVPHAHADVPTAYTMHAGPLPHCAILSVSQAPSTTCALT